MTDRRDSPQELISALGLISHPEGGFFRETYRGADESSALPSRFGPGRDPLPYCTSIYYLLEAPDYSAFHRIKSDELWYFHAGTGLAIHCLEPGGAYRALELGPDRDYFAAVLAGSWFAAESLSHRPAGDDSAVPNARAWCLVSCAVSPGFDFRDFELADRSALVKEYPEKASLIERLSRS